MGRWLQVDPLASKYPSLNPYNYVANNPIILVDPDGRGSDFNSFVSEKNIKDAAIHNSKIITIESERKMLNTFGPTALDGLSLCFVAAGPAGAPFAIGTSALSVFWNASLGDHWGDVTVGTGTEIAGIGVKNPKAQIAIAAIQLLYDVTLSGEDAKENKTEMFAPDNTRVNNSVQKSLLGLSGKSPQEMWDEVYNNSNGENSSSENEDEDRTEQD